MSSFLQQPLFTSGLDGYFRYRIPALITSLKGTILAFCEARKYSGRDSDQIDLLLRRSLDGGRSFGEPQVVVTEDGWVCGNPAPVLDQESGILWLLFCKNRQEDDEQKINQSGAPRTVWITNSVDDGLSWTKPKEITADVKPPHWGWYATGPGHGIQLKNGRLLIPCDHSLRNPDADIEPAYFSHVIVSDDHGQSWRLGGSLEEGTNECMAVETVDGRVYLNGRNSPWSLARHNNNFVAKSQYHRAFAWSENGGDTFSSVRHDSALPEPICQASICRLTDEINHGRNRIIFANPASTKRKNLTIRVSYDECHTWPISRVIHRGPAEYSDLCLSADGTILCLYERGEKNAYETMTLARMSLDWLESRLAV